MSHQDDQFLNDPIFTKLRQFAGEQGGANEFASLPMAIGKALRESNQAHLARKKLVRRVLAPITGVVILVPSLAYARVLPAAISKPVTHAVHLVAHVFNQPVVAVRHEISLITAEPQRSPAPTVDITVLTSPSSSASSSSASATPSSASQTPTIQSSLISQRARDEEVIVQAPITPLAIAARSNAPQAERKHEDSRGQSFASAAPSVAHAHTHGAEGGDGHQSEALPTPSPTTTAPTSSSSEGLEPSHSSDKSGGANSQQSKAGEQGQGGHNQIEAHATPTLAATAIEGEQNRNQVETTRSTSELGTGSSH
jgi:hypothetical protein